MSRVVIAVDPGSVRAGVAVFKDQVLVGTYAVRCKGINGSARLMHYMRSSQGAYQELYPAPPTEVHAVLEKPRDYGKNRKAGPNTLILLSVFGGAVLLDACKQIVPKHPPDHVMLPAPSDWKGNLDWTVVASRLKRDMSPQECRLVDFNDDNVVEAVGLGRWYCDVKGWLDDTVLGGPTQA